MMGQSCKSEVRVDLSISLYSATDEKIFLTQVLRLITINRQSLLIRMTFMVWSQQTGVSGEFEAVLIILLYCMQICDLE